MLKATEAIELLSDIAGRLVAEKTDEGFIRSLYEQVSHPRSKAYSKIQDAIVWLREEERVNPGH